jgi:hypothetical protein
MDGDHPTLASATEQNSRCERRPVRTIITPESFIDCGEDGRIKHNPTLKV